MDQGKGQEMAKKKKSNEKEQDFLKPEKPEKISSKKNWESRFPIDLDVSAHMTNNVTTSIYLRRRVKIATRNSTYSMYYTIRHSTCPFFSPSFLNNRRAGSPAIGGNSSSRDGGSSINSLTAVRVSFPVRESKLSAMTVKIN